MSAGAPPTATVIVIGDEILAGRTSDQNLCFLAQRLAERGVELREARFVRDTISDIETAINACRSQCDYVFTTGGIGPTHDDVTTAAVARAFGLPLQRNPEAVTRLAAYYGAERLNAARLRMAELPAGAELIDNPVSQAPGFRVGNVYVLPGVPRIMQAMVEHLIQSIAAGKPFITVVYTTDLQEGQFAADLGAIQSRFDTVSIGSYPFATNGRYGVRLVLRARELDDLELAAAAVAQMVVGFSGELTKES